MKLYQRIFAGILGMMFLGSFSGCKKNSESTQAEEQPQVFTQKQEETILSKTSTETVKQETTSALQSESSTELTESINVTDTVPATESTTVLSDTTTETVSQTIQTESESSVSEKITEPEEVQTELIQVPEETDVQIQETELVTEAPTTEPEQVTSSELKIQYLGQTLGIGESAEAFVKANKPVSEESAPSCYGNGENINYYYDDITLYVWNENGSYMIYSIDINAPGIAQVNGYDIDSAADFDGEKIINCENDCNIILIAVDGRVISISYNKNL